ncbi:hypothetical protein [Saccharicrinis aurantiacus]|uniref:hypothetical protein n=1 Tax=Saccharicrinis aurantiacus TaxID=1849719 RepID=UPI0009F9E9A6|nr:hypothetical protein [Saccharicrinis aurantiacus]
MIDKLNLVIKPQPIIDIDNAQKRYCIFERYNSGRLENAKELFYEVPQGIELAKYNDCDNYLVALIFDAMAEKRDIIIEGSISKQLLINLKEYIECWVRWQPDLLSNISISADEIRDDNLINSNCISAYSGGVDATFSVWKSHKNKGRDDSHVITSCAFIHGFDIPIHDQDSFNKALHSAENTLSELKLNVIPIKTNFREVTKYNWEHTHACGLVSALSVLKKCFGICIVGSSGPYKNLTIPWGSNPITDHLLSSGDFTIVHDGAAYDRVEKSEYIKDWDNGIKNLRVCWEGDHKGANCGICEKCIRTKVIFHMLLHKTKPDLYTDLKLAEDLRILKIKNRGKASPWRYIIEHAELNNSLDANTIKQLKRKMRMPINQILFPVHSKRRILLKKILQKN